MTAKISRPVGGTLEDWSFWYEQSTGEKLDPDPRETLLFNSERGFMSYMIYPEEREFYGHYVAGDGRFWLKVAKEICRRLELDTIQFYTRHNPKLASRLTGAHIRGYLMQINLEHQKQEAGGNGRVIEDKDLQ